MKGTGGNGHRPPAFGGKVMKIICRGCMVYVTVIESGVDCYNQPYEIAVSKGGRFFLGYYDPFNPSEHIWEYFSSIEKLINWKNVYITK